MRGGGFFVVRFSCEDDLNKVIEGGPWLMGGRPIVLRQWHRGMQMEMERLETIPIWIRFPQLPLHLWGKRMLSKLSSVIGVPLNMDLATANHTRIEYARICVEISAHSTLPEYSRLIEDGVFKEIKVACKACNTFGHSEAQCILSGRHQAQDNTKPAHATQEVQQNVIYHKGGPACVWVPITHAKTKAAPLPHVPQQVSQSNSFMALADVNEEVLISEDQFIAAPIFDAIL
ncbi:hypothetical protein QJS04_geneDACA024589 [Acorus gramineus]|uniref:DUF4283 domain-containing protein n=1 Tax=Acorus gramineus TaxID=55184 RepID=A0AAV8ZXI0_ACOGR|nr:hypothetical protein QJS04_geneDACA024589 [Acorus gramineus]